VLGGKENDLIDWREVETASYPNPASESVNLAIALSQEANVSVEVYDITGRVIFVEKAGTVLDWQILLDLTEHSSGVYTVKWIVDESLTIDRFNISK
jgi:hypothetical protein